MSLFTSFIHYCSPKPRKEPERPEPDVAALPLACASCPYGRSKPCSAFKRSKCIYASSSTETDN